MKKPQGQWMKCKIILDFQRANYNILKIILENGNFRNMSDLFS